MDARLGEWKPCVARHRHSHLRERGALCHRRRRSLSAQAGCLSRRGVCASSRSQQPSDHLNEKPHPTDIGNPILGVLIRGREALCGARADMEKVSAYPLRSPDVTP